MKILIDDEGSKKVFKDIYRNFDGKKDVTSIIYWDQLYDYLSAIFRHYKLVPPNKDDVYLHACTMPLLEKMSFQQAKDYVREIILAFAREK